MIRDDDIAVIGLAGRFPGAESIDAFWNNVSLSKETLSLLSDEQLRRAGVDEAYLDNPKYVRKKGILGNVEDFDYDFFNMSQKEASILDPQHRVLIECAWEAFENAGCVPNQLEERVGVFVGTGISLYLLKNLMQNTEVMQTVDEYQLLLGNDKDFLATRIGYLFNLKGPCVNVQTGCSSSLVAIHYACQSILNGECGLALAGGVSITIPEAQGYLYKKDMIGSPDGKCYAFDARAEGTVKSNGAGIVLLKLAKDAMRDNDHIYSIVRGTAINNDGALKVGFTAPSVLQQTKVIKEALQMAEVLVSDVGYVETHGTGTLLGDPIEVKALKEAFSCAKQNSCALTSLKSSIGHLDVAAGVAGFIRASLAVYYAKIPASLNFNTLNPNINLSDSPFYVNTEFKDWESFKRIACVSAFGIGGTNVHVVLENPPQRFYNRTNNKEDCLFVFSAKSINSLQKQMQNVENFIKNNPQVSLNDIAYTLQHGRARMNYQYSCKVSSYLDLVKARETMEIQSGLEINPSSLGQIIPLPTYAWNKERCFIEPDKLGRVDNSSFQARRPAACPRDPMILLDTQACCIEKVLNGSREQVAGRRDLNCQQTLINLTKTSHKIESLNLEEQISELWYLILGKKPERNDNFFQFGGTSLLAISFMDKLSALIQKEVSIVHLYQYPEFYAFVNFINNKLNAEPEKSMEESIFSQHAEL